MILGGCVIVGIVRIRLDHQFQQKHNTDNYTVTSITTNNTKTYIQQLHTLCMERKNKLKEVLKVLSQRSNPK